MPSLFIITGSNGAGKSTVGTSYLPETIQSSCTVFDGDKLFMQKQRELWSEGMRAHKEIKKLAFTFVENTFDNLVENVLANKIDFVYEGHFTNEATWDIPKRFKAEGYHIHLIFLGLADTDLSEQRVLTRLKKGGHYVNPQTVADNFYGNLEKLNKYFPLFDTVQIIDTSSVQHEVLAVLHFGKLNYSLSLLQLPKWFKQYLPTITGLVTQ
ncbi:zeta toxin family protein [Parasediminibacterium sp. JCM 36343]|uniref:zeta toxin family protein n=1 Tax=Parasediminibacterium sp. JCM 36343 TaxID=3374279 RepID=UPI00397B9237